MENQELTLTLDPAGVTRESLSIQESSSNNVLFGLQTIENTDNLKHPHDLSDNEGFFIYSVSDKKESPEIQRKKYKDWLIKKGIEDLIKGVNLTLIDTYKYGLLFKSKDDIKTIDDVNEIIDLVTKKTKRLGLPNLFNEIRQFLSEPLAHEENILSINRIRNCLVHRNGYVTDIDLNGLPNDQLKLDCKKIKLVKKNKDGEEEVLGPFKNDGKINISITDKQKTFNKGDKLSFDFRDFNDIVFTFSLFGKDLINKLVK
jgi:hypothetical protein